MATNYNINCFQGDYLQLTLNVKDASGIPINLSGYEIRGQVITNYSSGIISVIVPSVESSALPVNEYVYDIERYPSGVPTGNSIKLLKGKFITYPEVTRT
jgi:hypothetical protein